MAKIEFEKTMTLGQVKSLLQKNLGTKISVEIKKNRLEVVKAPSKGCLILLGEKDGRTTAGLSGYMPSGGLRVTIIAPPFILWFLLIIFFSQYINILVIAVFRGRDSNGPDHIDAFSITGAGPKGGEYFKK